MISRVTKVVACICFFCACGVEPDFMPATQSPTISLATPEQLDADLAEPNSYIVAFRTDVVGGGLRFSSYLREYQANYMPLAERYLSDPRIRDIRFITALDLTRDDEPEFAADFGSTPALQLAWNQQNLDSVPSSIARVDFTDDNASADVLGEWEREGSIWYAEPNYKSTLSASAFDTMSATYEPLAAQNFWMNTIQLRAAFEALAKANKGDDVPIVAVMDSGVDYMQPQLSGQMWQNDIENQSGCSNDKYGCNTTIARKGDLGNGDVHPLFTNGPNEQCPVNPQKPGDCPRDCCHGTHVAGIIAASPSVAGASMGGVCPICKIMAIRVVEKNSSGQGTILDSSIIAGLKYVTRFRRKSGNALAVRIINASFGKFLRSKTAAAQIRVLTKVGAGTILIGAAGNEDTMKMQYPAAYADAVAVANLTSTGGRQSSSNYGRWVDIAAPGTAILSTVPGTAVPEPKTGTSMAAPVVAGVAALMLVNSPDMSFANLRSTLIGTADPIIYTSGVNEMYNPKIAGEVAKVPLLGSGVVRADKAITDKPVTQIAGKFDRVGQRCGTLITTSGAHTRRVWIGLLLVLLPIFFATASVGRTKTGDNARAQQNQ